MAAVGEEKGKQEEPYKKLVLSFPTHLLYVHSLKIPLGDIFLPLLIDLCSAVLFCLPQTVHGAEQDYGLLIKSTILT